ncbi:hypothetical protein BV898_14629 [Hypsibius exemplaris]|uniref:SRR1-like domain-containing protein n=1 Tax=Hypsibius exemplaris TaxID=2072580 RepID=A0A9X6RJH7_HYPEX|nr:hypothetical protein BV898_14629 [Hypsibius exemplaris]
MDVSTLPDGFVTVKSRRKQRNQQQLLHGSTSESANKTSSKFLRRAPSQISGLDSPEEFASNIHEIHSSILRARSRILQECGPLFLSQLVMAFQRSFETHLNLPRPEEVVCFALGRFSVPSDWGFSCRLQLILLQDLTACFRVPVLIFDPAFSNLEKNYLTSDYCGFSVIPTNEEAKRIATKPTLFYMIHADGFLYDNLITANRLTGNLGNVVLFGNNQKSPETASRTWPLPFLNIDTVPPQQTEFVHVEAELPVRDRTGLFSVALTADTVLQFFCSTKAPSD